VIDAFASAIDALFADPNIGEDALWKAGGVGAGVAVHGGIWGQPRRVANRRHRYPALAGRNDHRG
jgi:hypothetical protein